MVFSRLFKRFAESCDSTPLSDGGDLWNYDPALTAYVTALQLSENRAPSRGRLRSCSRSSTYGVDLPTSRWSASVARGHSAIHKEHKWAAAAR